MWMYSYVVIHCFQFNLQYYQWSLIHIHIKIVVGFFSFVHQMCVCFEMECVNFGAKCSNEYWVIVFVFYRILLSESIYKSKSIPMEPVSDCNELYKNQNKWQIPMPFFSFSWLINCYHKRQQLFAEQKKTARESNNNLSFE